MKIYNVIMWFEKATEESITDLEDFLMSERQLARFVLAENAIDACLIAKEYCANFPIKIYREICVEAEVQDIARYINPQIILEKSHHKIIKVA